jgi:zinc-binding alcohol dehydrogenase family protein
MRAIVANGQGGPEVLSEKHVPVPVPGDEDLLIEVKASATNPVDIKARKSNTTPDRILGFDGAGIVRALGAKVDATRFKVGDEVFWAGNLFKAGSFADYEVVDARIVAHKPRSLDFGAAAAVPLVALTAWEPLFENLRLPLDGSASDRVFLFIGGAGGVGSAALQVAKHVLKAKTIIATASRPETEEFCRKLGATHVINHRKNLKEELTRIGVSGVDIAYCGVDLDLHYDNIIPIMNMGGAIIAITVGANADNIKVSKLFFPNRLTLSFEIMFGRPITGTKPELQGRILEAVAKLIDDKLFQRIDTQTFKGLTLENVNKALEIQESSAAIGKIVIEH